MHIEKLNTIQHNHSLIAIKDTFNVVSKRYWLKRYIGDMLIYSTLMMSI